MNIMPILRKEKLTRDDILFLLELQEEDSKQQLYDEAVRVREELFGNEVHLRGIIEFSNYCEQNCNYCGIRWGNNGIPRYRMNMEQILQVANQIHSLDIKTIVLQSGEDQHYTGDFIAEVISEIKARYDVAITLSLGERKFEDYDKWIDAGADRYLLKHETANPQLYFEWHNKQKLDDRLKHLCYLKKIGFQTGSGNIIGMPYQTIEDVADDILLCEEFDVDMASFSPFMPSENTPYANVPKCDIDLVLKTMAVARIYLRNVHIPATTALASLDASGREKGILAGANVVMPSYTPVGMRDNYLIYDNKACVYEDPSSCLSCLTLRLDSVGVKPSFSKGQSLKKGNNCCCAVDTQRYNNVS